MLIQNLATVYFCAIPSVFIQDFLRYVIGAGGVYLIVNLALAANLARRKIRDKQPPSGQIARELLISLRTIVIFSMFGAGIVLGATTGVFTIYMDLADYGIPYFLFSALAIIVLHDAYFYWAHRIIHRPWLFRRLHRMHHRSHNPTPFTSFTFDIGEAALNAVFLPLVLLLLPAHPLALVIFTGHMMLRNAMGHCGYELFPARADGRPLFDWMTTVTHHDLHHSHAGYNMGLYFTWWDRWMETEHPEYHARFKSVSKARVAKSAAARSEQRALVSGELQNAVNQVFRGTDFG